MQFCDAKDRTVKVLVKFPLIDLEARQGDRAQGSSAMMSGGYRRERLSEGTAGGRCDSLISAHGQKSGEGDPKRLPRRPVGRSSKKQQSCSRTRDYTRVDNRPLCVVIRKANDVNCWNTLRARSNLGLGNQQGSRLWRNLQRSSRKGVEPSGSKRVRPLVGHDMIWSDGKPPAVREDGAKLATWCEHLTQSFTWNVYNDVATQGTTLVETSTIAETNYTIAQGTGTVTELGNSVNDNFPLSLPLAIAA